MTHRQLFLRHLAQTSSSPIALEIVKAEGSSLWDDQDREYIDLIAGISVCNLGHRHPEVIQAIKDQLDQYMHLLVYGELVESPQVQYAALLTRNLPSSLDSVYFTNSGTEATEGAMKLAKRVTGCTQIISFNQSYHGSTQGALSVMGDEYWRNAFRPLLPDILRLDYNNMESLEEIGADTACVIAECIQAERGVYAPSIEWMKALRNKCTASGALLVLDEIQTGFGRTGPLWGFQSYDIVPDILLLGKALGGGLPLGAFIAGKSLMENLMDHPVLGHITTFGGHPVCCAAGKASLEVLLRENIVGLVNTKSDRFRKNLQHTLIKSVRARGLLMALEFENENISQRVIRSCIEKGVLTDWFLFAPHCLRMAPPLVIRDDEIDKACRKILEACEEVNREISSSSP